ncbi:hypothetical protein LPAF129_19150 [Ligilactobacillus pabuli]|uniref:Uncharacterized protein n=1 Tax=Ligilactobacillus pabuli TaxID=2886039 RepID=A0ABQ5JMN8_9LACO|nr:hypothetical protein [Ligilactobacillus pabuli]GKS82229.1 hypothetical protein LPAF129_19150 [Ligilactobacillus pabuli]
MTEHQTKTNDRVNRWLSDPKTFLFLGLVVIAIIVGATFFTGNPTQRYLTDQGWRLEINSGSQKYKVNVYFTENHAYGFVPQQKKLPRKNPSNVEYDKKHQTVTVYNSKTRMKFIVPKTRKNYVEGSVSIGNSSEQYSYRLTKDSSIQLK